MKNLVFALVAMFALAGCKKGTETVTIVSCETGIEMVVKSASTGQGGTSFVMEDGTKVKYSPAIKCAVVEEQRQTEE